MKRLIAGIGSALALTLALSSSAAAETASVCGPLREYRAPTATAPGSITVGSEQFAISSTAQQNIASGTTTPGTNVCLRGTWVMSQTVGRNLTEFTLTLQQAVSPSPAATTAPLPSIGTASNGTSDLPLLAAIAAGLSALAVLTLFAVRRRT